MRKTYSYLFTLLLASLLTITAHSQNTTVSGNVKNSVTNDVVPAVSVTIKGTSTGTFTDDKGNFRLTTSSKPPFVLVFSSVGFETQEQTVNDAAAPVSLSFVPSSQLGTEVVVSASRVPERILESPVSIERVNATAIRVAPAATYYDIVGSLKGVDVVTSSLTFKTPTTRGFAGSGNTRFNQLVDGMDNQAPGLNFSVGTIVGLSELDVDNMELLPGASSALYGPGGMNGTLLVSSKDPFKYTGLSFQIKEGIMNTDSRYRDVSGYHNWAVRWAQNVNNKFAYKINAELIQAKDWLAADKRNYDRMSTTQKVIPGTRLSDPNYDGINVYGDETTADIRAVLQGIGQQAPFLQPYINTLMGSAINVSRTGYDEKDILDPNTLNFKLGGSLNYRFSDKLEGILMMNWGTGNSIYTGSDRYSFKDFKMAQYKLELKGRRFYVRAYTTQENAGQSFNATVTTRLTNEAWKPTITFVNGNPAPKPTDWLVQYSQAYLANKMGGAADIDAHNAARAVADQGRPAAGSQQFKQIFDKVRGVSISDGGGLFIEKSDLYQIEGQYNLTDYTSKVAEVLVGGNYKQYALNSEGTLFTDSTGPIHIWEIGAYIQATRRFFNDRLKLTFSGRYDKNENFEGRFTPRATAVVTVAKNSNIRLSYQTAYRFPSTQQQFIDLNIGGGVQLIGGNESFQTYYGFDKNAPYTINADGTAGSAHVFNTFRPESVSSFELGYKGLHAGGKFLIDAYGYYGKYQDFLARTTIGQARNPGSPNVATDQKFSVPINVAGDITTYGWGLGLDYRFTRVWTLSGNLSSDVLDGVPDNYVASFNAPRYRANITLSNSGFGKTKRLSGSVSYRWQDTFYYEGDFANGDIHQISTVDAQFTYKLPKIRSGIKLGANNLLNQYYFNAVGNSFVGGLYYISFGYNIF
ncbi:TonB-dependent receptor [Flavihumibacter petaseus]|uniref:Putative TonB-dependent receptor n=1 Tax=Flavihumibacter petaseus NBRC 106054 TaxID=1220578 RepID=A0A0E9N439_9BACT|nr:TonB-dependent receptor [Flavihumibacter petaseus]GAO44747.1 putative TonB-dependent receptor [Flavihumibacter petaseus NBRC 106054]